MTHRATGHNRLCGDHVTVMFRRDGDRIAAVTFEGAGCALSTASASLMTDAVAGRTTDAALAFQAEVLAMVSGAGPVREEVLGDVVVLSAVRAFPARARCVTLAWETLGEALAVPAGSAGA
ncbi:MAG: SUF system NifU family Fe-S cluster assembly protein [Myxococcota bacterium]